ncbi:hypothetical protein [Chitinophaga sp. MM2321]|uniref:hypothetical protein n=1 Tax=Chitinophaga sp. MM2321 TaxID=3137178 RepID=UPI0032D59776
MFKPFIQTVAVSFFLLSGALFTTQAVHAIPVTVRDTTLPVKKVVTENDGSLLLSAEAGYAIGPSIKYMPEWKAFGWFRSADRVEWDVTINKKGTYDVYLEWSVSDEDAGKPFIVQAGKRQLKALTGKSGSWETFTSKKVGIIRLSAGSQKVIFKAATAFKEGALLDLREIRLVPVK